LSGYLIKESLICSEVQALLGGRLITSHRMQLIQRAFGFVILGKEMGSSHQISRNSFA
jgi:hypothetical protein